MGIIYGVILILLLLVPPLLTLFDRGVRTARATRSAYTATSFVLWAAFVVGGLTVPDSGDGGHLDSALSVWTGMPYETSTAIFTVVGVVAGLAYLLLLVLAIVGIVRGRAPDTVAD